MTQIDVTAAVPASASLADPERFLPSPARPAGPDRWVVEFAVGPFHHEAVVTLGSTWRTDDGIGRSIQWMSNVDDRDTLPYEALMPTVQGMLVLDGETLALHVRYEPAAGVVGRLVDPVLRPLARSSVRDFLHEVARAMRAGATVPAGGS